MTWMLALALCQQPPSAQAAPAAAPVTQADQIRSAMAASIEKQLASVRAQAQAIGPISFTNTADPAPAADTADAKGKLAVMMGYLVHLGQ